MAKNQQSNEINLAKSVPWLALLFLIIFLAYLWPGGDSSVTPVDVKEESTATIEEAKKPEAEKKVKKAEILELLNFRSQPSNEKNVIIGRVSKGDQLNVIEEDDDWLKVEKSDGSSGYITNDSKYVRLFSE